MIYPLDQVVQQISRTEHQLMYHLILEQQETNRLLRLLVEGKTEEHHDSDSIDDLKRPDLMKRIAKLENKPQGWNKWETEDMRKFLKEAG